MDATTELEALERRGWDSLCDGSGDRFYGGLMTDDGVMVLVNGVAMTRDDVVGSLAQAPTWDGYDLEDVRVVEVGHEAATLVYRATARRAGDPPFTALMTSTYVRLDGAWRLAVYTQTAVPA